MEDSKFKEKIEELIRNKRINKAVTPLQHNLEGNSKLSVQSDKKRLKIYRRKSG